jgi:tetratricopeptide (TPR) repeat protein
MTTWNLTFQQIKDIKPSSIKLLQVMSFLDPDEIPRDLLSTAPALGLDNPLDFDEAMRHLLRFSLVSPLKDDSYRLHRLVGLYTREQVGTGSGPFDVETTLKIALDALSKNFPDGEDYKNMAKCNRLMPHVTAIINYNYRQKALVDTLLKRLPGLQHNCGGYLSRRGKYNEALMWYQGALQARERIFEGNDDHPDTLNTINSIGNVYESQAKYDEALKWLKRALSGREKVLGNNHPDTLQTVHSMANALRAQAKLDEAMRLYRRALDGREKDPDIEANHPETLRTVNCIANVFYDQGKCNDALDWYRRALAGREKALGDDHPDTLHTIFNIAGVYRTQEKYDQALECGSKAFVGLEKALGADHPITMKANNRIADILRLQKKYDEALKRFERTLVAQKMLWGSDHRQTLDTVYEMADTFLDQGEPEKAIDWFKKVLAGREKVLGSEHPDTRATMSTIAVVLEQENKYDDALAWYRKAIAGQETADDHDINILYTFQNIAGLLSRSGKDAEAVEWFEKSFAGLEKTLGISHPITLHVLMGMAVAYEKKQPQPNYKRALELAQRALAEIRKVTADSHHAESEDLAVVRQEMERIVATISADSDGPLTSAIEFTASPNLPAKMVTEVERHDDLPLETDPVDVNAPVMIVLNQKPSGTSQINELSHPEPAPEDKVNKRKADQELEPEDGGKKRRAVQELELADAGKKRKAEEDLEPVDGEKRRKVGSNCIIMW